jgi:hypothetical protein
MLTILEKIEEHDIKTFELLFKALVENSNDENVIIVYKKFIHLRLNPTWEIFSLVSKIIKKKQNAKKKSMLLLQETKADNLNEKFIKENKMEKIELIRDRILYLNNKDEKIFSEDALINASLKCDKCKTSINIKELCSNLSTLSFEKDQNEKQRVRCRNKNKNNSCNGYYDPLIKINLGIELYNKITICNNYSNNIYDKIKTSLLEEIELMSPDEIKKSLLNIYSHFKKEEKFDVELFRLKYPDIFWNLILYFEYNNIDISFMLPYSPLNPTKNDEKYENEFKNYINYERNANKVKLNENNNEKIIDLLNDNIENRVQIFNNIAKNNYKDDDLILQNVYNFEISENLGIISYKSIFLFEENVGFNELPIIIPEKDNCSTSCESINLKNEQKTYLVETKKSKHRRNLSSSLIYSVNNPSSRERIYSNHLSRKNIKRENSVEVKCFEFEDSDDSSSSKGK